MATIQRVKDGQNVGVVARVLCISEQVLRLDKGRSAGTLE